MRRLGLMALLALAACGIEHRRARARAALEEMDLPRAERLYRAVLARAPEDPEALYGLGWTYHLSGQQDQARLTFERCIDLDAGASDCMKGLGSVALATGNLEVARVRFERALARAPGDPSILNSLALLHLRAGRVEEALGLYEQLCREAPGEPTLAIGHAEALLRSDRSDEALAEIDRALVLAGSRPREEVLARTLRARILLAMTSGRVDGGRCAETVPPILAWLEQAERDAERARSLNLDYDEPLNVVRQIRDRRRAIRRQCPDLAGSTE